MSRRVATSRRSRCCSTSHAIVATSSDANPIRSQMRSAMSSAGRRVVVPGSLADVVQQRRHQQEVRPGHLRREPRRGGDRLQQMPVDGEVVERARLRPGSHRIAIREARSPHTPRRSSPSITRIAHGPEPRSSISSRRVSSSHGSSHGEAAAASRSSDRRSMTAPWRAAVRGGTEHEDRIGGVDVVVHGHLGVAQAQPGVCGGRADRARRRDPRPRVPDRLDTASRRHASSLVHAMVRAASAIRAINSSAPRQAERARDGRLMLRRQHVRGTPGQTLQLDAGIEEGRVRLVERRRVLVEQDVLRRLRPPERVHVPEATSALLEVRLRTERVVARLLVPLLDAVGDLPEHLGRAFPPSTDRTGGQVRGRAWIAGHEPGGEERRRGVEIVRAQRERIPHRADAVTEVQLLVPDGVPDAVPRSP